MPQQYCTVWYEKVNRIMQTQNCCLSCTAYVTCLPRRSIIVVPNIYKHNHVPHAVQDNTQGCALATRLLMRGLSLAVDVHLPTHAYTLAMLSIAAARLAVMPQ